MRTRVSVAAALLEAVILMTGCAVFQGQPGEPGVVDFTVPPAPEREFRAAWIATVANSNWPSKPGLSSQEQKQEAIALLDLLADNNLNAAVFQVRPQCDAMYPSALEPWSYYLTGAQGQAPYPYYDPLEFWVAEAHKRGIELHVWLNPYRAHHVSGGEVTKHSVVSTRPELVVRLESGYYWMDPALKGTQDHSLAVVMDIVRRYDIDGVHFDDYFYPYPEYNNHKEFPDHQSWTTYQRSGGKLSRNDWRRAAVSEFIERLYREIKKEKPHVKFGLSPFGIWRPHNPVSIRGLDQYNQLYADARLWLNEGWIDYWSPQLYWPTNQIPQSYPVLLGWWERENRKGRHFWPGIRIGSGGRGELGVDEVVNQIMIARGMLPESPGVIHWSIGSLRDQELIEAIHTGPYQRPALIPRSPWLDRDAPAPPEVSTSVEGEQLEIRWSHEDAGDVFRWVIHYRRGGQWDYTIANRQERSAGVPLFTVNMAAVNRAGGVDGLESAEKVVRPLTEVAVTAVDRVGNESARTRRSLAELAEQDSPTLNEVVALIRAQQEPGQPTRPRPRVRLGVDVLVEEQLDLVAGKRAGLITNPSAVGADLRSTLDILADHPEVNLVALFGAEHGVRGALHGRIVQEGEIDPQTGIPVYSLYGGSFTPRQEWLEQLDVMLFDIQGVGAAWYTFKYSMSHAMEACAQVGVPFVVLDRPNPLGGRVVEGPFLGVGGSMYRHDLPLRHGMTYGELATMWNETEGYGADLTVVRMQGWRRRMTWDDTGLFWVMPSPNMGTLETAIVYPGQCLFERTNMSEGRGTTKPFLMVGAPWVDCARAAEDLNSRGIEGAVFRPAPFIPRRLREGGRRGKPWNEMSCGIEIMLHDYKSYRSVESALHIIDACRTTNPDSLTWSPPETLKLLDEPGVGVEQVIELCQEEVEEFVQRRREFLLYR